MTNAQMTAHTAVQGLKRVFVKERYICFRILFFAYTLQCVLEKVEVLSCTILLMFKMKIRAILRSYYYDDYRKLHEQSILKRVLAIPFSQDWWIHSRS